MRVIPPGEKDRLGRTVVVQQGERRVGLLPFAAADQKPNLPRLQRKDRRLDQAEGIVGRNGVLRTFKRRKIVRAMPIVFDRFVVKFLRAVADRPGIFPFENRPALLN